MDGVLLNSEKNLDWLIGALKKTLEIFNIYPSEENIKKIHSKNVYNFQKISQEFRLPLEDFWHERNRNYINEKITAMEKRNIVPYNDVDALKSLKKKFKLGIISNSPQEVVNYFLKEFNFTDLFDIAIGREGKISDLKNMKPNTFLFGRLQDYIKGCKIFYIGDTENDRLFAKKTGMEFLHLSRDSYTSRDGFSSLYQIVDYLLLQ
jgi:phosphoglycolate phosphatase